MVLEVLLVPIWHWLRSVECQLSCPGAADRATPLGPRRLFERSTRLFRLPPRLFRLLPATFRDLPTDFPGRPFGRGGGGERSRHSVSQNVRISPVQHRFRPRSAQNCSRSCEGFVNDSGNIRETIHSNILRFSHSNIYPILL